MGIVHDDQTLYVANYGSTRRSIEWYSLISTLVSGQDAEPTRIIVLVSGLQNTTGLQLGSDGKLYFAYALGNRGLVGRVDPQVCLANGGCTQRSGRNRAVQRSVRAARRADDHAGHAPVRPHDVHAGHVLGEDWENLTAAKKWTNVHLPVRTY